MNQYEAGYQDTKPSRLTVVAALTGHKPSLEELTDLFRGERMTNDRLTVDNGIESDVIEGTDYLCEECTAETEGLEIWHRREPLDNAPDDRHFFPVMTKSKTVYEVIYGAEDDASEIFSDWEEAYAYAKASAKDNGHAINIEVTEDKEYTIG